MTIRILTSHPALRYVLDRTAPFGTTVHATDKSERSKRDPSYTINIDSAALSRSTRARVLFAWIFTHLRQYGVSQVEIDGHAVGADEIRFRRALRQRGTR